MKTLCVGGILLFLLAGCSQPLKTLMDLGSEQNAQQNLVAHENAKFESMCRDVMHHRLKPGMTKKEILAHYGAPVLEKDHTWLYRKPAQYFDTTKIYLVFDANDILIQIHKEGDER